ncbi:MAG: serine/threonine-protein kinase [Pseudonocardiales bacterium]
MGVVWQARDERLHRLVAVKQLRLQPDLSPRETEGARQRALREARIAARLQHPNAIVVYDVAEHDGEPCLVMEYLPSRSLGEVLAERGCLPVSEVAAIGRQVASALAAAHAAQIVHRDVKPGNILITDGGTAKITDFGVSRAAGDVTITQTGMMAGTPAYLAPEVARGQTPTPASDVFSLGATLFAAIEGRAPFGDGENQLALLHAVAAGEVEPPQNAGPLTSILMSLLAKDPAARPDMAQASVELAALMNTRPVYSTSSSASASVSPKVLSPKAPSPKAPQPSLAARATPPPTLAARPVPPLAAPPAPAPHSPAPASRSPALSTAAPFAPPPARPATARPGTRPVLDPRRRRAALLAGAVLVVLVLAGLGGLMFTDSSQNPGVLSTSVPVPAPAPEPAPPTSSAVESTSPTAQPVEASGGSIGHGEAGQRMVDYYVDPSSSWQLLSPRAQQEYFSGSESEYQAYWSGYQLLALDDARIVASYPDGSLDVTVAVLNYRIGDVEVNDQPVLRVTRLGGRLVIDSDPR